MIKPAVEEAGLECYRADEIVHSGVIDVPMYQQILTANVVIADLSTTATPSTNSACGTRSGPTRPSSPKTSSSSF